MALTMSGDSDFEPKRAGNNYIEDVGSSMSPKDPANAHGYLPKHGDRALALVGDQHIELTEEDVWIATVSYVPARAHGDCRINESGARLIKRSSRS